MNTFARFRDALRYRGLFGLLGMLASRLGQRILPSTAFQMCRVFYERYRFDRKFGIDTAGTIPLHTLNSLSVRQHDGASYEPITPSAFHRIVAPLKNNLAVNYRDFTFVDLGSGKGRSLLLASEYPFKQIIGVEFSSELHQIAVHNIHQYRSATQQCRAITSICMDAAAFTIPPGKVLVFMYNPFGGNTMRAVLGNIEKSLHEDPRELFIVYGVPKCGPLFDEARFLTKLVDKSPSGCLIYMSKQAASNRMTGGTATT